MLQQRRLDQGAELPQGRVSSPQRPANRTKGCAQSSMMKASFDRQFVEDGDALQACFQGLS